MSESERRREGERGREREEERVVVLVLFSRKRALRVFYFLQLFFFHFSKLTKLLLQQQQPTKSGPTELAKSVSGIHGFLSGAVKHVLAAGRGAAAGEGAEEEEGAEGEGGAAEAAAAIPRDGRALIEMYNQVLQKKHPEIENNRELIAMFQAVSHYWKNVVGDNFRARTFEKVAKTLAKLDEELGVLDSPAKFKPLCVAGKEERKLEGFSAGTFKRAKQWMETGLPEELKNLAK